jgi:hypothetical protein
VTGVNFTGALNHLPVDQYGGTLGKFAAMKLLIFTFLFIQGLPHLMGAAEVPDLTSARTLYQYPEGPFCYGQFTLKHLAYNLKWNKP